MAAAGRQRFQIASQVLPRDVLKSFDATPNELYHLMDDSMVWVMWLAEHRLIHNSINCSKCERPMTFVRRTHSPDGYTWQCSMCQTRCSIRTGSFFEQSGLSTQKIVMMMFYWLYEVKAKHVRLFEGIDTLTTLSALVNYNNYFRLECSHWLQGQRVELGGFDDNCDPVTVEVDVTYFFHRKYRRQRPGSWVVGIVERGTYRCWLEIVEHRDAPTLELIISKHVLPGSIIITDASPGYANLSRINNGVYQHEVTMQTQPFTHPIHPDIHTRTIERLWMHAKRKLRQGGTSRDLFSRYLSAFQWRFSHKEHVFGQYLKLLSENCNI